MLTKNEIKYIQSLVHKNHRDEDKVFVAEGPKLVDEIINSGLQVQHVYATANWLLAHTPADIPCTAISDKELARISGLQSPNEVLLIAAQKVVKDEPVFRNTITLVLDGIQDPGNLGTILRTADWFGLQQVVCSSDCADVYNPKVVQATMGSIARANCWYKDFETWQPDFVGPVFGALLAGANIYSLPKISEGVLVIGSEGKGIRSHLLPAITHPVTIPKTGGAESLNAAVAASIIMGCFINGVEK